MLAKRSVFHCAPIKKSPQLRSTFFESLRISFHGNGDSIAGRQYFKRCSIKASRLLGSRSRASLAYIKSVSIESLKAAQPSTDADLVNRSVIDAVAERMLVIPYADSDLQNEEHSLIESSDLSVYESSYCWEEAWKLYMRSQTAVLTDISARVEECDPQITTTVEYGALTDEPAPHKFLSLINDEVYLQACHEKNICEGPPQKETPSLLSKLRVKKLRKRRINGLILLNVLAALYGSSTVAGKLAMDVAPGLPPSLSTLVRFSSALLVFLPVLVNIVNEGKHSPLLKAGAELGGLLFTATILETCGNGGASSDAPVLFAFTVIFVPIMELCAGRQSVRNITRFASLVALSGMGVLEEEGLGWKGISLPQVGDAWGLAASAIYAFHIFRSEAHSKNFRPLELTAIQCGTVASLSWLWEILRVLHENTTVTEYTHQLQALPWGPLVYTGLVSSGLCSWLEIHGLRYVHASTATIVNTTIPIWGAFMSSLRGETLEDSAIVGGLAILVASLFAQLVTTQDDINSPPAPKPRNPEIPNYEAQTGIPPTPNQNSSAPVKPPADYVQGAIITSQLKFPFYVAQAKRLLLEAKIKLLTMKSVIVAAMSTMLPSNQPLPPGSLHSTATSVSLQTLPSNATVQWLDIMAGCLEFAITALSSDVVQAAEEAEDMARFAQQASEAALAQVAIASASATSFLTSFLHLVTRILSESFQFVDTTTASALADRSVVCAHHVDVAVLQILLACAPPRP